MTLPGRPRGRVPTPSGRGADPGHPAMSASRGGILIGIAVVIGLLMYSTIDGSGPSASTPTPTTAATPATNADGTPVTTVAGTATTNVRRSTTTTAAATKGARANDQVVVQVLNGSGLQGAATQRSNDLKTKGYQLLGAGNAPATRQGSAVQCKAGYEKEAQVLVNELAGIGVTATIEAVPNPVPAGFDTAANCYVLLGK
jgi:hypothetical protein